MFHRWVCEMPVLVLAGVMALPVPFARAWLLVDNFERHEILNVLGNPARVFEKGPSHVLASRRWIPPQAGLGEEVLMLRYVKRSQGGPNDEGGWCGYYTLLKTPGRVEDPDRYLDGSMYGAVTFWVRGEKGDENFVVGLVDQYWDKAGDSARSSGIGAYLPAGKVTTEWQKAVIPFSEFMVDFTRLAAVVFLFEGGPPVRHAGTVYIDNIALE